METVICEYCGKEILKDEAIYYEAGDYFVCKECWEDECAEILFLAMKRIKASTATSASVASMIYSDNHETPSRR